jgi:Ca2+-binding EF-hand superfamily protein
MKKRTVVLFSSLLSLSGYALCASTEGTNNNQPRSGERFNAADKDGNGRLSKEEVTAGIPRLSKRFDALDTNKDGQLSRDELSAARAKQRNQS